MQAEAPPNNETKPRLLIVVPGEVGDRMTGPAIRGWEIARSLSVRYCVTVMCHRPTESARDNVTLVAWGRRRMIREARRSDVVMAPWHPPFLFVAVLGKRVVLVADLYDPAELELVHADTNAGGEIAALGRLTRLQVQCADVITTASESQAVAIRELSTNGGSAPVLVVLFGVPEPEPDGSVSPLHRDIPGIDDDDVVLLWWGSLWRWLDPVTAIHAAVQARARIPTLKLVFTGATPPDQKVARLSLADDAREVAEGLGLLDDLVFFYDEWVSYETRGAVLRGASMGITLHHDVLEASVAARARYLDYLWCGLPCVLAEGDEMAAELSETGLARLVPIEDVEATAEAIVGLALSLGSPDAADGAAARTLAETRRWARTTQPLAEWLTSEPAAPRRRRTSAVAVAGVAAYYVAEMRRRLRR